MTDRHPGLKKALYGAKNRIRIYPGQYWDEETGLHYNYYRYYDPNLGKYLRTDPLGIYSGDVNLYLYVSGNPIVFNDPFGLVRHPVKCLKSLMKAWIKCWDDLEKARKQIFEHLDDCEEEWGLCNGFGLSGENKCIEKKECEKWEDVGSASGARLKCANDSDLWKKAAKDNISKKCAMAAAKSIVDCL